MKKLFYITLIFSVASLLIGAEVSVEKAQRVAGNIFAEHSNIGTMDGFNLRSVDIIDENAVNLIYVFQLESEGFILAVSYTHLTLPKTPYV